MQRIIPTLLSFTSLLTALIVPLTGCGSEDELTASDIREFADPITESMLEAANNGDYVKYSSHFDNTMKAAVSEYAFSGTNTLIKTRIGDYISKEFSRTETELDNIIVYYDAAYTLIDEPVEVKVVFNRIEDEWYVVGLWYNSPALTE